MVDGDGPQPCTGIAIISDSDALRHERRVIDFAYDHRAGPR